MKKILPSFLIVSLMAGPAFSACKYFRVDAKLRACQAVDKRTIDGKNPYQPEMSDPDLQEANDQKLLQVRCDCEYSLQGSDPRCDMDQSVEQKALLGADEPANACSRGHSLCRDVCPAHLP